MGLPAEWMIAVVGIVCTVLGFLIAKMLNNTDARLNELEKDVKELERDFSNYKIHVLEKLLPNLK